jgi:hypothetical protein
MSHDCQCLATSFVDVAEHDFQSVVIGACDKRDWTLGTELTTKEATSC